MTQKISNEVLERVASGTMTKDDLINVVMVSFFNKKKCTLDLSGLDFSDKKCVVDISHMKVNKGLIQNWQEILNNGILVQNHQLVNGDLEQGFQEVTNGNIFQDFQNVTNGNVFQSHQRIRIGNLYIGDNVISDGKESKFTMEILLSQARSQN